MNARSRATLLIIPTLMGAITLGASGAFGAPLAPTSASLGTATLAPPVFFPMSLQLLNGASTVGRAQTNDRVIVLYSKQVKQSTLCSSWSNITNNRSLVGFTFTINDNAGSSGNDTFTVTAAPAACAGGFHFGTINLGANNYVTGGNARFTGSRITLNQTPLTTTLTFTLGLPTGPGTIWTVGLGNAAVYTGDPAITDTTARPIGGNKATSISKVQF